jgi:hypothetical protein
MYIHKNKINYFSGMRRVHSKLDIYILKSQISQPMVNIRQTIGNKKIDISK